MPGERRFISTRPPCLSIPGDLFTDGLDFHVGLTGCQSELKDPREVVLAI